LIDGADHLHLHGLPLKQMARSAAKRQNHRRNKKYVTKTQLAQLKLTIDELAKLIIE